MLGATPVPDVTGVDCRTKKMAGTVLGYQCSYCFENVTSVRVKCSECTDFDLCLQCFSCGAEIGKHKSKHKYTVADCGNFPLFQVPNTKWSAKEETQLLSAIEEYGYGNWEEIAQSVGNEFSAEDVQEHYNDMYVLGNTGEVTWKIDEPLTVKDHTGPENGPLSPSLTNPIPPLELSLQEQQELGYMPYRDDFEKEYDNDAESLTSSLVFVTDDDEIEKALKLAQVDMYTRRLSERVWRKKVAREHGLVNLFFSSSNKQKSQVSRKKISKDEKEFQDKMQTFARFYTQAEQEHFFDGLQKEKDLKTRIKELTKYRKNGLTKIEDVNDAELGRYKPDKKENKKKPVTSTSRKKSSMALKGRDEKGNTISLEENGGDDNKKKQKQLKFSALPEYKLLSLQEKKLCSALKLKPSYYITFKTTLLKADLRKKQGKTVKSRYPAGLEKSDCLKIVNFMISSGWITAASL